MAVGAGLHPKGVDAVVLGHDIGHYRRGLQPRAGVAHTVDCGFARVVLILRMEFNGMIALKTIRRSHMIEYSQLTLIHSPKTQSDSHLPHLPLMACK